MTDTLDLPKIGEPGTAEGFQLERLREWGLGEFANACTTREQAILVHHCALYVRNVWHERFGEDTDEVPVAAVRHCVGELVKRPEMLERADHIAKLAVEHDDVPPDLRADPEIFDAVVAALEKIRNAD